jgi:hypothetical protein
MANDPLPASAYFHELLGLLRKKFCWATRPTFWFTFIIGAGLSLSASARPLPMMR